MIRPLLLCLLCFGLLAAPAAARAPVVGIGDQNPFMFSDPAFRALEIRHSRLALAWNWHRDPHTVAETDAWIAAAQAAGVRPLIAFNRDWSPGGERRLPSVRAYRRSFRLLRQRYPHVREFSAWNEANHSTQPTAKRPRAAARLYNEMLRACPKCRIVAADVLDSSNMVPWIRAFQRHAKRPRLWGLHNYKDANDGTKNVRALLQAVRGEVWLTETGGIRRLKPAAGSSGSGRRHTFREQAAAVRRVYRLAAAHRRVKRVYFYEWRQNRDNRWDSAFLHANGKRRPAYFTLRALLRGR